MPNHPVTRPDATFRRPADPARRTAFHVLHRVLEEGAYANLVLASAMGSSDSAAPHGKGTILDATQRAFVTALVYGTLTRLYTIDHILSQTLHKPFEQLDAEVRTILRLGAFQLLFSPSIPESAACDESVRLCRHRRPAAVCGMVNATLRKIAREKPRIDPGNAPLFFSLPPELYGYLKKAVGAADAPVLAAALLEAPPVTLRVNLLKSTVSDTIRLLADEGIQAASGRYAPEAVRLELGGRSIRSTACHREGLVSVQDEGAMLTVHVLDPKPGERIIDLCAAPGGKTAHMAEITGDRLDLTACDIHENRLTLISGLFSRLGLKGIRVLKADATGRDWPLEAAGPFDRVLADVPCSGLGLLARKPEIRRNMTHEKMVGLLPVQAAILDHAATLVKPGGTLVYSTCTFNPAENDIQVDRFLERQGGRFKRTSLMDLLPESLLAHADIRESAPQGSMTLLPHRHGTDGFFMARLMRVHQD